MEVKSIDPTELHRLREAGQPVELIDVRTPIEYREMHVPFARNIPLHELDPQKVRVYRDTGVSAPIYVICRSGSRGKQACEKCIQAGLINIINVAGGTLAWAEQGLPLERGKPAMSLERQVRITAGSLILVGVLLSFFVHEYFIWLAGIMGAGLVFAGVTNTCGMGMMLARMPWNRISRTKGDLTMPCAQPAAVSTSNRVVPAEKASSM